MLQKYWFFIGIGFMVLISFSLPQVGQLVRDYKVLNIGIFLAFFLTGLSLTNIKMWLQFMPSLCQYIAVCTQFENLSLAGAHSF